MKHISVIVLFLPVVFALVSCKDSPDKQVIRSFYGEYWSVCEQYDFGYCGVAYE